LRRCYRDTEGFGVDFTAQNLDIARVTERPTTHPKMTWATLRSPCCTAPTFEWD